jgi:hypothetical protein
LRSTTPAASIPSSGGMMGTALLNNNPPAWAAAQMRSTVHQAPVGGRKGVPVAATSAA